MQIEKLLRGYFCAYFFGTGVLWLHFIYTILESFGIQHLTKQEGILLFFAQMVWAFFAYIVIGAIPAVIVSLLATVLWLVLAYREMTVAWWSAPLVAALIYFLLIQIIFESIGPPSVFASGVLFSCAVGIVFWLTAFGREKRVFLTFKS